MKQRRDLAIVLRAVPYGDRHCIVTALTENHGKISAMARNAIQSRRFGGTLDLLTAGTWSFTEKREHFEGTELYRLDGAEVRYPFEGIRISFEKLSLASTLSEIMLRIAPTTEPCEDLFRLHSNALTALEESQDLDSLPALLNIYLIKVLQWAGNQPRILACHSCANPLSQIPDTHRLSGLSAEAAWLCPSCGTPREKAPTARWMKDLVASMHYPIRKALEVRLAPHEEHRNGFRFLEALVIHHIPGFDRSPLKALRFLGLESNLRPL